MNQELSPSVGKAFSDQFSSVPFDKADLVVGVNRSGTVWSDAGAIVALHRIVPNLSEGTDPHDYIQAALALGEKKQALTIGKTNEGTVSFVAMWCDLQRPHELYVLQLQASLIFQGLVIDMSAEKPHWRLGRGDNFLKEFKIPEELLSALKGDEQIYKVLDKYEIS